ncbi:MAG TPA: GNAT family N-acetyltransferase [Streptosporangiaceae bacterium]
MVEIRFVGPDDRDALFELRARAFGPLRGELRERVLPMVERDLADQRVLGGYDGARLVASGRFLPMDQWWHGCAVPTGGVASVYVAPDERGRGIGARLAAALIELVGARGRPLSALYPATVPVYRRAGYEHGGAEYWTTFRAEALRGLGGGAAGDVKIRQVGPDDAAEVVAVLRAVHAAAGDSGPLDRGEPFVRWTLEHPDLFAYLADDGFVAYHWSDDLSELIVERAVAGSAETARALWALVGSGSSTAEFVRARVAPYDPVLWLLRDHTDARIHRSSWMLRVVDAQAAIAARGFPAAASVQASLVVDDPLCPGNAGGWRLIVAGGRGRLERDAAAAERPGVVRLTARGLAAVYAGVPPSTLGRAGLIDGGGGTDIAALAAAFAASPYMLDDF